MSADASKQIMAQNIKRYMDRKGVSNQQLCADLGFKYTTFMDWIKGVTYPRIGKIEAMANYFGCEKSDLIEEKTIGNSPVEMAERHIEMIMDEDLNDIFEDLQFLDVRERKMVKDLAHNLRIIKTEA